MSREKFSTVKKGHLPIRQEYNTLTKVVERFASFGRGSRHGRHGGSFVAFDTLAPWSQFIFEITDTTIDEGGGDTDTDSSGLYKGKIIWYSHEDEEWKDDETKEWFLDENGTNSPPTFSIGNRIIAYWDEQRGMFVPISSVGSPLVELMVAEEYERGVVFKAYLGAWCPQDNTFRYNCDDNCEQWVWAIDFRYGVPYPGVGARGMFTPMPSAVHGTIYVNVSMDCETPGPCDEQEIDQPCPEEESTNYDGLCSVEPVE